MDKKNGNGNGNGNGSNGDGGAAEEAQRLAKAEAKREELGARKNADGTVPITDLVELSVVSMYFLQKTGKLTVPELKIYIERVHGDVDAYQLTQAVEALQARGLISYSRGRKKVGGESVRMFKPRQTLFSAPPEMAHIMDLLPSLVATEGAEQLVDRLNKAEEEGDGTKKAKRALGYDHYWQARVTFMTADELLGSQPPSPWLDRLVASSPYNGIEEAGTLRFWRDPGSGGLVLGSDAVRGWLRTGLRSEGYSDAVASYISVSPAVIQPVQPLVQTALPVVDSTGQGGGKGITSYETIQPGERFTLLFRLPRRGFMSPEQFRAWLVGYAPQPIRGISPARGARFGKLWVVGFENLGECRSGRALLESVMPGPGAPPEARAFYEQELERLQAKDIDLRKA